MVSSDAADASPVSALDAADASPASALDAADASPGALPQAAVSDADQACSTKSEATCAASGCLVLVGRPFNASKSPGCWDPPVFAGCRASDIDCDALETATVDPGGRCWLVQSHCHPVGWWSNRDRPKICTPGSACN